MSNIDFQNGFICGMATKGLVRSGDYYMPRIYNDEGVYSYFYIDFNRSVMPFSLGMWNESIVVHDSEQLTVTKVEKVSEGLYKVYCDISDKVHGITVINKKTSRLRFGSTGEQMSVFSTHMFVSGIASYDSSLYLYDTENFPDFGSEYTTTENEAVTLSDAFALDTISESAAFSPPLLNTTVTETHSVVLT